MPRPQCHPLDLFFSRSGKERARLVVAHPCNSHLVSISSGEYVLDIRFNVRSKSRGTLAALGRGSDVDVFIEGSSIAKIQCSFKIDIDSKVVMLYDRSNGGTTQVYGDRVVPYEQGCSRRVVVGEALNTIIGMAGVGNDLVQSELEWRPNQIQAIAGPLNPWNAS